MRTYWSLAEAALAKTVLDNYEISCALLDENASRYNTGAQFAVPVRLVVDEDQALRAIHILNADFAAAEKAEIAEELGEPSVREVTADSTTNRNAWELLVVAFYLLVPAICLILTKFPSSIGGRWGRYMIARVTITKFLSWVAVLSATGLVVLYFRLRRRSESDGAASGCDNR